MLQLLKLGRISLANRLPLLKVILTTLGPFLYHITLTMFVNFSPKPIAIVIGVALKLQINLSGMMSSYNKKHIGSCSGPATELLNPLEF